VVTLYEVEGAGPGGGPKRTWTEVVQGDCRAHELDGRMLWIIVDGGSGWRMIDGQDRFEWVNVSSGSVSPG